MKQAKNVLIVLLVITALFQTERLWFEEFSSRNFFLHSFPFNVTSAASGQQSGFAEPYRIVVNPGGNRYRILYNELGELGVKRMTDTALRQILKDGVFEKSSETDWNEILKDRSVLYEYAFSMPMDAFTAAVGQKSNVVSSRVKAFDTLVIVPKASASNVLRVFFLDKNQNISYCFSANQNQISENLQNEIAGLSSQDLYYISSQQSGFDYFAGNIFIPQWLEGYSYPTVRTVNPYEELTLSTVEEKINVFFNNPAAKWRDITDAFTYGSPDEPIVVKYYPNHVLEYSNYTTYDKNSPSSLPSDYGAAAAFIKRDSYVTNEYYLAGYKEEGEKRTFYFNFTVNDLPLILSEQRMKDRLDISHPIEITVERGNILKYRKLVYNYEIDDTQPERPTTDFIQSLNEIIGEKQQEDEDYRDAVTKVELGYIVDIKPSESMELSERLFLNWHYEINGRITHISAQK